MYKRDSRIETKVGFFVLLGLAVVATTVIYFGRLGRGLQEFYDLQVDFPNASGLIGGSDVLLGGARIGYVAKPPAVLPEMQGVAVELKIRGDVNIPVESKFIIGSSGLLGNRFVDVIVSPTADLKNHIAAGSTVQGQRETGFEDLTRDGAKILAEARQTVQTVNESLARINATALSQQTLDDIRITVADLRETVANFKKSSEGFSNIGQTAKDFEVTAAEARKLISSARSGPGPLPMLLNDKQVTDDLRATISNIRRHGVLWYKNSYGSASPASTPAPPRKR